MSKPTNYSEMCYKHTILFHEQQYPWQKAEKCTFDFADLQFQRYHVLIPGNVGIEGSGNAK